MKRVRHCGDVFISGQQILQGEITGTEIQETVREMGEACEHTALLRQYASEAKGNKATEEGFIEFKKTHPPLLEWMCKRCLVRRNRKK